jgi:hypothetical protein
VRSTFALLAAALLSGCGLTDGPNRTGSSWLEDLDLGPQGLETVSVPANALRVLTMLDPGVPALNGVGAFSIGHPDGLGLVSSVWFDPQDTSTWILGRPKDSARGDWKLEVKIATTCPAGATMDVRIWSDVQDTLPFLLGAGRGTPNSSVVATCIDSSEILVARLGDSAFVTHPSTKAFGLRFVSESFPARVVKQIRLVNGVGDTLLHGMHAGRGAWGSRWSATGTGSISSAIDAGSRLRIRFDGDALRGAISSRLGLDPVASDSFDNTVSIYSARAVSRVTDLSANARRRFRLASWVVLSRDSTILSLPAPGGRAQADFKSRRPSDGSTIEGTVSTVALSDSLVGISILYGTDSATFVTTSGSLQKRFHLFAGDSIEATLSGSKFSWVKLAFQFRDGKLVFTRTILAETVVADDQANAYENRSYEYREEAIASAKGPVRYEARSAFQRVVNRKAQEVWTDLYVVPMDADSLVEGNAIVTLATQPVDSVTFQVRRRPQGVVQ